MGYNSALLHFNFGSKGTKSLKVLINRPAADITSAWKRYFGTLIFAEQSSDEIIRRANLAYIFVINADFFNVSCIDTDRMTIKPVYIGADFLYCF